MAVKGKRRQSGSCEQCGNYVYDEDYECYACEVDLSREDCVAGSKAWVQS